MTCTTYGTTAAAAAATATITVTTITIIITWHSYATSIITVE